MNQDIMKVGRWVRCWNILRNTLFYMERSNDGAHNNYSFQGGTRGHYFFIGLNDDDVVVSPPLQRFDRSIENLLEVEEHRGSEVVESVSIMMVYRSMGGRDNLIY